LTLPAVSGLPLAAYRTDHVHRCAIRACQRERVRDLDALAALLATDADARLRFRTAVAAAHSALFRDAEHLRWIDRAVLPGVTAGAKHLRVWSAGCTSGEEAYTLVMMLEWHGVLLRSEVVGTDILEEALAEAETGVCSGTKISPALRTRVTFDRRDLTNEDAPATDFDMVLCRRLLPYFTDEAAATTEATLAASLAPGGVLVLGRDEALRTPPEALGLTAFTGSAYRKLSSS
jgi:chemotaxis protein methyltransferase CheR